MSHRVDQALQRTTDLTRRRYGRMAGEFDRMEAVVGRRRMAAWHVEVSKLVRGQQVSFAGDRCDSVAETSVACSAPDPLLGLRAARRDAEEP